MRRTMAGLMASTIPSATAWRARSALVQCVMFRGVGLRPRMRVPPRRTYLQHNHCPEFVAGLRSRTTSTESQPLKPLPIQGLVTPGPFAGASRHALDQPDLAAVRAGDDLSS